MGAAPSLTSSRCSCCSSSSSSPSIHPAAPCPLPLSPSPPIPPPTHTHPPNSPMHPPTTTHTPTHPLISPNNPPTTTHTHTHTHPTPPHTLQVMCERVSREAVLQRLRQHLTANLVRLRRAWCVQRRGIPQGSTLSTLLCSLYLAHLERTQLAAVLAGRGPPAGPHGAAAAATGMDWAAGEGQDWEPGQMLTSGGVRTGAPAGDPGEQVMLLGGGAAAAVAPAAVISLGRGGSQASASSSSRGLLSELARAAGSSSAHEPRPPASAATASPPARRAGKEGVASPAAPQRSRVGRPGGEAPTGDLLLLPAGASSATPAPPARAAGSLGPPAPQHGPAAVASPPPQRPHAASPLALHTGSLLLRLVDDFLLITAVPAVAQGFAARMLQGVCLCVGGGGGGQLGGWGLGWSRYLLSLLPLSLG
jgi:hypothetical protein